MAQIQKLIERILRFLNDFTWEELKKVLRHLGYTETNTGKTGGSRRKFAGADKHIISLHKPHPGSIMKQYQLKQVVEVLTEKGFIKNE
ncbi:MAG TPA: type II toxin-antitoxin system HicA family toxin [Puia sp.]|jgi:hypothetical protein|nr:type II toxin-antitoxin system HicA family toxin [Puia sp.]